MQALPATYRRTADLTVRIRVNLARFVAPIIFVGKYSYTRCRRRELADARIAAGFAAGLEPGDILADLVNHREVIGERLDYADPAARGFS